jgi:Tol biopolymer transport system component
LLISLLLLLLVATSAKSDDADKAAAQAFGSVRSDRGLVTDIKLLNKTGGRVCWSPRGDVIAMDRKGRDGYYDVFLVNPDGTNERCITDKTGGAIPGGNNGQPAWHPSGELLVFQAEKRGSVGHWGRDIASTPGFGGHSDLWLVDLSTNTFHQLTRTANSPDTGVLHAHFSKDGKWLSWSESYGRSNPSDHKASAGYWRLKVARFHYGPEGAKLTNIRTYEPGGPAFYENHGFSADGTKLLYTSNCEAPKKTGFFKSTRIYQLDLNTESVEKLTADGGYNEHALYTPDGKHIVWMSGKDNRYGTDYWVMDSDGRNKRRITDFNNPKNPSYKRRLIVAADHSFSPDGTKFVAYLQYDLVGQMGITVVLEVDPERFSQD